jgi:hypothetical protein
MFWQELRFARNRSVFLLLTIFWTYAWSFTSWKVQKEKGLMTKMWTFWQKLRFTWNRFSFVLLSMYWIYTGLLLNFTIQHKTPVSLRNLYICTGCIKILLQSGLRRIKCRLLLFPSYIRTLAKFSCLESFSNFSLFLPTRDKRNMTCLCGTNICYKDENVNVFYKNFGLHGTVSFSIL